MRKSQELEQKTGCLQNVSAGAAEQKKELVGLRFQCVVYHLC